MLIAIVGCLHGELDNVYENIKATEDKEGIQIDLLICCGDFQATRNSDDLKCMAVPQKYQSMCSFYKYYSGEKTAPVLTLFVGGNHEASNYLQELPYGGWVAPNIFYLGYAGVVNYGGVKIGGISGIYKGLDYMKGHFEKPPYSENSKRSVYHVRNLEVFRLKQLSNSIDIMISHDWPKDICDYGDKEQLLRHKPFFREDIDKSQLGSEPCSELLHHLKPTYWLAAHLHTKFVAVVPHTSESTDDLPESRSQPIKSTRFLALDKCLQKRRYLQLLELPTDDSKPKVLEYDLEWLTILFLTNHLLSVDKSIQYMPGPCKKERWIFTPSEEEKKLVLQKFKHNLKVPQNFSKTVPAYSGRGEANTPKKSFNSVIVMNPQTIEFCSKLSIDDPMALLTQNDSSFSQLTVDSEPTFGSPSFNVSDSQYSLSELDSSTYDDFLSPVSKCESEASLSFIKDSDSAAVDAQPDKNFLSRHSKCELLTAETLVSNSQSSFINSQSQCSAPNELSQFSISSPDLNDLVSQKEEISGVEKNEIASPQTKKFKRRNHSLYCTDAEDILS